MAPTPEATSAMVGERSPALRGTVLVNLGLRTRATTRLMSATSIKAIAGGHATSPGTPGARELTRSSHADAAATHRTQKPPHTSRLMPNPSG